MKEYTVTFVFSKDKKYVLLIYRKHDPGRHYLNGLGGKIEPWEYNYKLSAIREVHEETDKKIFLNEIFSYKTICSKNNYILHVYYAFAYRSPNYDWFDIGYDSSEGEIKWYKVDECINNRIDKLELFVPFLIKGIIKKEQENENKKLLETSQNNY
jgi:8-oxo-dGTP pyrophosphatase MutT (NUDIX family)